MRSFGLGSVSLLTLVLAFVLVPPSDARAQVIVGGEITSDTFWTAADSVYVVEQSVIVREGATLTIEPGVIVKFADSRSLDVSGGLVTSGADSTRVVFTSERDSDFGGSGAFPGGWPGIRVFGSVANVALDHAWIRYATDGVLVTSGATANVSNALIERSTEGIDVDPDATLTLSDTTVRNTNSNGIVVDDRAVFDAARVVVEGAGADGVTFTGTTMRIRLVDSEIRDAGSFGFEASSYSNTSFVVDRDFTEFRGNTITGCASGSWVVPPDVVAEALRDNSASANGRGNAITTGGRFLDLTPTRWEAGQTVYVSPSLRVDGGTDLTLAPGSVLKFASTRIEIAGTLRASGVADSTVTFTSYRDGSVGGLTFTGSPSRNDFYGVWVRSTGTFEASHSVIRYGYGANNGFSGYAGLVIESGGEATFEDGVIELSNDEAVENAGTLVLRRSVVRNARLEGVRNTGTATIEQTTIEGNGTEGIWSQSGSVALNGVVLDGNGRDGLYVSAGSADLFDVVSQNNAAEGFDIRGPVQRLEQCRAIGNARYGFALPAPAVTSIWEEALQNQLLSNGLGNALYVFEGSITTDSTWINEYPYVIGGEITVVDQVRWTLEPSSILKFGNDAHIFVRGALVASGSQGAEIVFTSLADDTYGPEIDGTPGTLGNPGDWQGLSFVSSDAGSSLSFCIIRNAGRPECAWAFAGVLDSENKYIDGSSAISVGGTAARLDISNCVIERTSFDGSNCGGTSNNYRLHNGAIRLFPGATVSVSESDLRDNVGPAIFVDVSDAVVRDNTIERNGRGGVEFSTAGTGGVLVGNRFLENDVTWSVIGRAVMDSFARNEAIDNDYGFAVRAEQVPLVWGENTLGPNRNGNPIGVVNGGTIAQDTTWIAADGQNFLGTYVVFTANIRVADGVQFTLPPGVVMKFDSNVGLTVDGGLVAEGTQSQPIVFTAFEDDEYGGDTDGGANPPSFWQWIRFEQPELGTSLSHVIVRYAGRSTVSRTIDGQNVRHAPSIYVVGPGSTIDMTNVTIERGAGRINSSYPAVGLVTDPDVTLNLSDSIFRDNGETGLQAYGPANLVGNRFEGNASRGALVLSPVGVTTGNVAQDNGSYGFTVHPDRVDEITQSNTNLGNGPLNYIGVAAGTVSGASVWASTSPLEIAADVTVASGASLTLEAGTIAKFRSGAGLFVDGTLKALADPVNKIVLTSTLDDNYGGDFNGDGANTLPAPGDWQGVVLRGGDVNTELSWTQISYAGGDGTPALQLANSGDQEYVFNELLILNNATAGIQVDSGARARINVSDIYGNAIGVRNNSASTVDARGVWWGSPTGPFNATANPGGLGNPIVGDVDFSNQRGASIDNPWTVFASPATSGNFQDATLIELDGDDLRDLIIATESNGLRVSRRSGVESWSEQTTLLPSTQVLSLGVADLNGDSIDDLVSAGPLGVNVFLGTGTGNLAAPVELGAGLGIDAADVEIARVNEDLHEDIVVVSGGNEGVYVFYGDGTGNFSAPDRPSTTLSYNRVEIADVDNDTRMDIVATNAENFGVHAWRQAAANTWEAQTFLDNGKAYFGLAVGDVDNDGNFDVVAGANETGVGIRVFLGDGTFDYANWTEVPGPTTADLFNDLELRDLNGDGRLDLASASQGTGVRVWLGTSSGAWNFWYHPIESGNFRAITLDDLNLDGSTDMLAVAQSQGIALWANNNPATFQDVFVTSPNRLVFGDVAVGECARLEFTLTNDSADTLQNVLVYTTSPQFSVTEVLARRGLLREAGPLTMLPGEQRTFWVEFCPSVPVDQIEAVVVRSTGAVTNVRMAGRGVPAIDPVWLVDLEVTNAPGDSLAGVDLAFGAGIGATDGLDPLTLEECLPPIPPTGVFDARFLIADCGGDGGSLLDLHDVYNITDQWTIRFVRATAGEPVTLQWDPAQLPSGTFTMQTFPAVEPAVDMASVGEYVVTNAAVEQVTITTTIFSTFAYDFRAGWQLASLPVTPASSDPSTIFPGAEFLWSFDAAAEQYVQPAGLVPGAGYWLKSGTAETVPVEGVGVRELTLSLEPGWNLIGAIEDTLDTQQLLQDPPNSVQSIFGFNLSYFNATSLMPGQGYWVNVDSATTLTLDADPLARAASTPAFAMSDEDAVRAAVEGSEWLLPVTIEAFDGNGVLGRRTLHVGAASSASAGIDVELGESQVPPMPPRGVFDARLNVTGGHALHRDVRSVDELEGAYFQFRWQVPEATLGVRFSWDSSALPENMALVLTDDAGGRLFDDVVLDARGEHVISGSLVGLGTSRIELRDAAVDQALPRRVALLGNIPNPFNPTTAVRFALPRASEVRIRVYDVSGRLVRTLAAEEFGPGEHEVVWYGKDDRGAQVASGTYLLRMQADGQSFTRKMMMVK